MKIKRAALIYDNQQRPETTGVYCQRALQELLGGEVVHFLPQQIHEIPRSGFDLYLNIDDGLRYRLPPELHPCAWWVIDTHMDPEWAEEKGPDFDWRFAAQRDGAQRLVDVGLPTQWLPLAFDPAIHRPHPLKRRWDFSFVGRVTAGIRQELLMLLQRQFPNSFIGQAYFDEYARVNSQSRIGFNRSIKNDINMRVFETLGCGTLLVTNDLRDNGQEELVTSDKHLVTYQSADELVDKIRFYASHDQARERLSQAGYAEAMSRHTYRHRMQSLLQAIENSDQIIYASDFGINTAVTDAPHANGEPSLVANPNSPRPTGNGAIPNSSWLDQIDIIIKTFLRPQALLRLLNSLLEFYPQARVTIADDGNLRESADADSRNCCRLIDPNCNIKLHSLPFALGVTAGRNFLVDHTDRLYVLLLDDDFCVTAETKIERFLERLESDPEVGFVAGACIDVAGDERRPRNSGGTLRLEGDTLFLDTNGWCDRERGLRDYVPQFGLIRREVFADVRWDGGIGAEHYDFCLQLQKSRWKVGHDLSVTIDHHHFTPALPGYAEHRFNYAAAQQWLLQKWNLRQIVQDGQAIVTRNPAVSDPIVVEMPMFHDVSERIGGVSSEPIWPGGPGVADLLPSPMEQINSDTAASKMTGPHPELNGRTLPQKDSGYFQFPRPEVVALIPLTARRVLDIGCGAGALGAALKNRQPTEVVGIEFQPGAAAVARTRLDLVVELNVEDPALDFEAGRFDCIVCADILEHLREPSEILVKLRRWLTPDGVLVASIPNARHHSVVGGLIEGNWTYETAGLLDSDHVRFFTRREIEKLLFRTGFAIDQLQGKMRAGNEDWEQAGRPGEVRIGPMHVCGLSPEMAAEFFTYQYLVAAKPAPRPRQKLTSIVIVMHNQCEFTKGCIDSIRLRTDEPYELVFVDNGSTDWTVEYLRNLKASFDGESQAIVSDGVSVSSGSVSVVKPGLQAVQLIENPDNRGFPAAVNQGLKVSRGEYIFLLNNDTLVTTGWLANLQDVLESDSKIGLVGPCSNCVSGEQMVPVSYTDLASLDGFAWDWGKKYTGVVEETDRLIGFCLGIKREVIEQIGLLDEQFGIGCFEDDDLCLRAINAGWRAVIARAAFIHHFGSQTFRASGVDLGNVLETNREKFRKKWNSGIDVEKLCSEVPNDPPVNEHVANSNGHARHAEVIKTPRTPATPKAAAEFTVVPSPHGGLLLQAVAAAASNSEIPASKSTGPKSERATSSLSSILGPQSSSVRLSLCMIVRDNEATIGPALESILPWVDEIIVVDTGSRDRTPEICRNYGAEIHEFPWCDDFSAARNESLKYARGQWIFWMDSDDTISADCGRRLRALADAPHADNVLGYIMQVHCPGPGDEGQLNVTAVDHVKLIRNRPDLRFEGRIHEQLLPAIRRVGGDVAWTDIYVRHSGSDHSPDGWKRKLERDLRILHAELGDAPNHPFVLFNLGMTYADAERWDDAIAYLQRCVAVSTPDESHLRKAFALLVNALSQVDRHNDSWATCQQGMALYPDDKELLFRSAILHHHFGRLSQAAETYQRVLNNKEERHFTSIDVGLSGFKARHNLAIAYDNMGRLDLAEAEWRRIVAEVPEYHLGWRGLGESLLRQGKFAEAEDLCQELSKRPVFSREAQPMAELHANTVPRLANEARILRGKLALAHGDAAAAVRELQAAKAAKNDDLESHQLLCRILFEHGDPAAAEAALQELTVLAPDDAAAHDNLGTVRLRLRQPENAAKAFRASLKLRPNSVLTHLKLGYALKESGAREDAARAWKTVLQLDPGNAEARIALTSI